jgi:hypothetical protein
MNGSGTNSKSDTPLTHPGSRDVHPLDTELDYLGKMIARCPASWPDDPKVRTLQAQITSWNKGGNRGELRKLIRRTIDAIRHQ